VLADVAHVGRVIDAADVATRPLPRTNS
jgi:hypothetical protein